MDAFVIASQLTAPQKRAMLDVHPSPIKDRLFIRHRDRARTRVIQNLRKMGLVFTSSWILPELTDFGMEVHKILKKETIK